MREANQHQEVEALLEYVKQARGFDFTAYKRTTLLRRVQKRMSVVGIEDYTSYVEYLEVHPGEFADLFNTILINVTGFFRDSPAWDFLSSEIVPRILSSKETRSQIRVWSAGCATGEEACTLAIIMAEALGIDQARERVKVYATDADEEALTYARQAVYQSGAVADVPAALREKYFEPMGDSFSFHKDLRRAIIFGRHDLVQDAPISRIDLLVCRNTLMYFNAETQARILARFHFALNPGGFLFLGKAETLLTFSNLFTAVDLPRRIFARSPRALSRDQILQAANNGGDSPGNGFLNNTKLRDAAFDTASVAQIVLDPDGRLRLANHQARLLFGVGPKDIGRPIQDMEMSYRPAELRSLIEQSRTTHHPAVLKDVDWPTPRGEQRLVDVTALSLADPAGCVLGSTVTFTDVSRYRKLQDELTHTNQELETTLEELQSTNEELETTNEELQSTVEELETTNEELQSTNEELETMNEELHSTNAELQTINDELRERTGDLDRVNIFLGSILTSFPGAVIVVDRDLRIQIWSQQAEDLRGLRHGEVEGKYLLNLDIGLPVETLLQPLRSSLAGDPPREVSLRATDRRGKVIRCRTTITPLRDPAARDGTQVAGAVLLIESSREPVAAETTGAEPTGDESAGDESAGDESTGDESTAPPRPRARRDRREKAIRSGDQPDPGTDG